MQPPQISHSFHWWSDWLTHPLPGICKLKAGSCHTPARESASSTGAAPSRSRDQALPKGAELHEPLHVPGETATCWWRTSKLRLRIWDLQEYKQVMVRAQTCPQKDLKVLRAPAALSPPTSPVLSMWCHVVHQSMNWNLLKTQILPTRSGGPSTPTLGEEGLLTQGKKSRVPAFHCENYTAFPVGNS